MSSCQHCTSLDKKRHKNREKLSRGNQPSSETLSEAEFLKACATALTVSWVTSSGFTSPKLRCVRIRLKEQINAKLTTVWSRLRPTMKIWNYFSRASTTTITQKTVNMKNNEEQGYCHLRFRRQFSSKNRPWEGCYHWSRTPPKIKHRNWMIDDHKK